mgnify:CR=1 FL=1
MTKISVDISERGGVFYATSEEMPGFLLCNTNAADLRADILPAMQQFIGFKKQAAGRKAPQQIIERVELLAA